MKRTLKCAVAMAGAAAVMIGAAVPAGAVCVKTQKAPCYSCGDINSIIKGIDIQSILGNGGCGSDCIKDIISSPSCGGNSLGNNNSCNNGSCGSTGSADSGNTGSSGNADSGSSGSGNVQNPTWGNSFDFNKFLEYITGNSSSKPDTDVTKPDTGVTKPDTDVTKPDTGVTKPDTGVTKPDAGVTKPDTGVTKPNVDSSVSEYEKEVVRLVNEIRVENGLNELTLNTELSDIARLKSQDMKDKGYFSHTSPTYGSPFDMMKSFGITYKTAGENIAMGYRSPESVVEGWMNSKGHRENILKASYTEIGVGYVSSGNYWTQMFIGR